jgi:hypothetical protein
LADSGASPAGRGSAGSGGKWNGLVYEVFVLAASAAFAYNVFIMTFALKMGQ